jgi:hypothetical protein
MSRAPSMPHSRSRPRERRRGWTSVALAGSVLVLAMAGPLRADIFTPSIQDQIKEDMVAAEYNPQGMLDLFRTLTEAAGKGEGPAFLADHPLTAERIQRTQERINRLGKREFRPEVPLR